MRPAFATPALSCRSFRPTAEAAGAGPRLPLGTRLQGPQADGRGSGGDHDPGGQAAGTDLQVIPHDPGLDPQGTDLRRLQVEGFPRRQPVQGRQQQTKSEEGSR